MLTDNIIWKPRT